MYKQYVNDPMDDPDVSSNSGARRTPDAAGPAAEPSDAAAASKKKEETVKLQVSCKYVDMSREGQKIRLDDARLHVLRRWQQLRRSAALHRLPDRCTLLISREDQLR